MRFYQKKVNELLALAGISVGGSEPFDIVVNDPRFYRRLLTEGRMGLGESYMDGWWDCERIDEMMHRLYSARERLVENTRTPLMWLGVLAGKLFPKGHRKRSHEIGKYHYDLGNELFEPMLGPSMAYTCAYWPDEAKTLEHAQNAKMDRVCRKLQLEPGMTLLDIGCGFGTFAKFAAENYGAQVTGISVSEEQLRYARRLCRGLPVEFRLLDYRDVREKYDRIASIGMFEHVGRRFYRTFMERARDSLVDEGILVLHTLGFNTSDYKNPWLTKYIFPGGFIPSLKHVAEASEELFTLEHVENIGPHYAKTLISWYENFEKNWEAIRRHDPNKYDERFFRTWRYYLLSTAPGFLVNKALLWQFVFSKSGVDGGYRFQPPQGEN